MSEPRSLSISTTYVKFGANDTILRLLHFVSQDVTPAVFDRTIDIKVLGYSLVELALVGEILKTEARPAGVTLSWYHLHVVFSPEADVKTSQY